jgi:predicted small integral membrane protein
MVRLSKIALVGAAGFFLLLVVFNNLTDYDSNFRFVSHVLTMDTTFPNNHGLWRAFDAAWIHHVAYAFIIAWEAAAMAMCFSGARRLWRYRRASANTFNAAKRVAIAGLTLSLLQWFLAFLAVGGEWFLMWQSRVWNGQEAAGRLFAILGIILIFVNQKDEDPVAE